MARWETCPASLRLATRFPNLESEFAKEGTKAHELADWLLSEGIRHIGPSVRAHIEFTNGKLPEDMLDAVQVYLNACWAAFDESPDADMSIEERFSLHEVIDGADDMFGTNDCAVFSPIRRKLTILDYKHGAGVGVEVENNPQLLYYALGAAGRKHNRGIETIELVVVQPRFDHPAGPVRRWTVSAGDLLAYRDRLIEAAEKARDPNAPFNPGKHCRFCPAAGMCKAQARAVFDALRAMGWMIDEESGEMAAPEDEVYTTEQLLAFFEARDQVKAWMNRVDDQTHRLATEGAFAGKLKFVAGRKARAWKDEDAAYRTLKGIIADEDELVVSKVISPAQAEKLVKKVDKSLLPELEALVDTTYGAPILVPHNDKRDAITVGAEADFEVIGE